MIEYFGPLSAIPDLVHGFTTRVPGLAMNVEREQALCLLESHHRRALAELGFDCQRMARCRQVHGAEVIEIKRDWHADDAPVGEADALVTARQDIGLGVHVADCCAVYAVDPTLRITGLAHAGRKGTEQGVVTALLRRMIAIAEDRADPARITVVLSPCIRPPAYEVDFAADIIRQCLACGLDPAQVHDPGTCTHRDPERYYSYRRELGRTGRMLAFMGWRT